MTATANSKQGLPEVPLHAPLSAKYKDTFAYPTIKDRCPVILCKVIDHLHRQRNNMTRELGGEASEGLYKVVEVSRVQIKINNFLSFLARNFPS